MDTSGVKHNGENKDASTILLLTISIAAALVIFGIWVGILRLQPDLNGTVVWKSFDETNIGALISTLLFVSLAVQSTLEVFISNFRRFERKSLESELSAIKTEVSTIEAKLEGVEDEAVKLYQGLMKSSGRISGLSGDEDLPENAIASEDESDINQLPHGDIIEGYIKRLGGYFKDYSEKLDSAEDAEKKLDKYRNDTRWMVAIIGLLLGLLIAAAGVRVLAPFVSELPKEGVQRQFFNALDIILTASLISGGSGGINRLTAVYESVTTSAAKNVSGNDASGK